MLSLSCTEKGSHPLPVTTEFQCFNKTFFSIQVISAQSKQGFSKKCSCESSCSVPPEPAHEGDFRKLL